MKVKPLYVKKGGGRVWHIVDFVNVGYMEPDTEAFIGPSYCKLHIGMAIPRVLIDGPICVVCKREAKKELDYIMKEVNYLVEAMKDK